MLSFGKFYCYVIKNDDLKCLLKMAGVITNHGSLKCIISYHVVCTMHAGWTANQVINFHISVCSQNMNKYDSEAIC